MPDWSMKIVAGDGPVATFVADRPDVEPGAPLPAGKDDLVTWNNMTEDTHQPWPANPDFTPLPVSSVTRESKYYLSDPILPGGSSRPSWKVPDTAPPPGTKAYPPPGNVCTLFYCCLLHPKEQGRIIITG
jgi:hypothetical protein